MAKANKQRGEISVEGPEGKSYRLCLTLGAIAQLEDELNIENLTEIGKVMGKARMKDLLIIFVALLNGGGHDEVTTKDMIYWQIDLRTLMSKIREAFEVAGFAEEGDENLEEEKEPGNLPAQSALPLGSTG